MQMLHQFHPPLAVHLTILAFLFYALVCIFTYLGAGKYKLWKRKQINFKRVLLVIAHPDDECMFFGPTILHLLAKRRQSVYILCLSAGRAANKHQRKKELWNSCDMLGFIPSNVMLINYERMKDDPNKEWPTADIRNTIFSFINSYDIDTVITFDRNGVSGHKNHCAIYETISELLKLRMWPKSCKVYALESVSIFRKYIINILDIWYSYFRSTTIYLASPSQRTCIRIAMNQHKSQLTWYRYLYIVFSRYLYINTLYELKTDETDDEDSLEDDSPSVSNKKGD